MGAIHEYIWGPFFSNWARSTWTELQKQANILLTGFYATLSKLLYAYMSDKGKVALTVLHLSRLAKFSFFSEILLWWIWCILKKKTVHVYTYIQEVTAEQITFFSRRKFWGGLLHMAYQSSLCWMSPLMRVVLGSSKQATLQVDHGRSREETPKCRLVIQLPQFSLQMFCKTQHGLDKPAWFL